MTNPLDVFLDHTEELPPASVHLPLEQLILQMLALETKGAGVRPPVTVDKNSAGSVGVRYDAILQDGLPGVPGPAIVEIKAFRRIVPPSLLTDRVIRILLAAAKEGYSSALIIVTFSVTGEYREHFARSLQELLPGNLKVLLWGYQELREVAARNSDSLDSRVSTLTLAPLAKAAQQPSAGDDWAAARDLLLQDLEQVYRSDGISLFLGAGVSAGSGLPSWGELLGGLFLGVFTRQLQQPPTQESLTPLVESAVRLNSSSPLLIARYLRRGLSPDHGPESEEEFSRAVAAVLYRDFQAGSSTELLEQVARLCVPLRRGPRVHSVITYNFDDLLEELLDSKSVRHLSIYSPDQRPNEDELPVYHAHGFLPRERAEFERLQESLLAFSEEGYHELYANPYHWSNIAQINALRDRACVLLGLSLTDPNLRRLLEISARDSQEPRHYVFMKRVTLTEVDPGGKLDTNLTEAFLRVHHVLQEQVMQELGLRIVWVEDYSELPQLFAKLMGG